MAKFNHQRAYQAHYGRIERYARMIDAIFKDANLEAAKIALSTGHTGEKLFTFADYPAANKRLDKLLREVAADIQNVVLNGERAEWDFSNQKNDDFVKAAFGSKANFKNARFAIYFNRNEKALEAFQKRRINGLGLSDKVWKLTKQYKQDLELSLDLGIRDGRSAAELSRDIRHFLNKPNALFRRVRDEHGNLALSKNALSYNPGAGQYRSAYKNAMRLARTEINMAYRTADEERWKQLDFVVGYEVKRSGHGYDCALCDSLAGRYPKDFRFVGWHPHCRCYIVPILKTADEMAEDSVLIMEGHNPTASNNSENAVKDIPDEFKEWLSENKERMGKAKSLPYFLRDNSQYISLR